MNTKDLLITLRLAGATVDVNAEGGVFLDAEVLAVADDFVVLHNGVEGYSVTIVRLDTISSISVKRSAIDAVLDSVS